MGATYMTTNCVCSYCLGEDINPYQGNIIFKPIITNLISENDNPSEEERVLLVECENSLKKAEEIRVNIADKFRDMLDKTGAGVLFNPTFERAIISFIIYFFEQICIYSKDKIKNFDIEKLNLTNFIKIDISGNVNNHFIEFNPEFINNLKTNFGFDMDKINELAEAKNTIINFLFTITKTGTVLSNQYENFMTILLNFKSFSNNISIISKLKDSLDGLKFILNFLGEIISSLDKARIQLNNPIKLALFIEIAKDAAEKFIRDPKELVIAYSLGVNCGDPQKWEDNMIYKEVLKY